ncbi:helix-turn-helix transcriptional regulator [Spirosoma sp. BT702]|uniref:Helix-turn-helix transcriptional regulator n=1 Tax=Spirosoma profusum TaxID=2771354 RepID=A0A926XXW1_9BACT|nr:helix-turn-helix transcriptional regulator [Spirosoma profusum]MBD2700022.1 helix-turn-helix transcriptional regulator [Spirosoma profusum]
MTISPFDIILLLGTVQGFILVTLLWTNKKGRQLSNRLLATLIGLLALMSLAVGFPQSNRYVSLTFELLPFIMAMPIGPLIYFYSKSMLDPSFQLGKRERRHFYPIMLDMGAKIIGWVFIIGLLLGVFEHRTNPSWGDVMDEYNAYVDIPRWISVTVYLFLTRRFLNQYEASVSNTHYPQVRWLRQFVTAFLIFQTIWLIHLIPYINPTSRYPLLDLFGWYPIYIPLTILIYWLGFKGYLHTRSANVVPAASKPAGTELPEETVNQVADTLRKAMVTDRLFLDPELTVEKVGQHTQLTAKLISAVLNQHLNKGFNSFINEYRIKEVTLRLVDPAYERLTLTGIAFECGFNSQATFQRTFKQLTGVSPKEYVNRHVKNTTQIQI